MCRVELSSLSHHLNICIYISIRTHARTLGPWEREREKERKRKRKDIVERGIGGVWGETMGEKEKKESKEPIVTLAECFYLQAYYPLRYRADREGPSE